MPAAQPRPTLFVPQPDPVQLLDPATLAALRSALLQRQTVASDELDGLRAELVAQGESALSDGAQRYSQHVAEEGSDAHARESAVLMLVHGTRTLGEIESALERFGRGSYGQCIGCGQPIGAGRLAAMPEAARCIGCQTSRIAPRLKTRR